MSEPQRIPLPPTQEENLRTASTADVAAATDRAFFEHCYNFGPASRADTARAIGISRPTASESAQRLLDRGLLKEVGTTTKNRGRTAVTYNINAAFGHTLAIAITASRALISVTDIAGYRSHLQELPVTNPSDEQALAQLLHTLLESYLSSVTSPCLGIGISVANPILNNSHSNLPTAGSPFPAGNAELVREVLEEALPQATTSGHAVVFDNDVNWELSGEISVGVAQQQGTALAVHVGSGFGAALSTDGTIHRGAHGIAGEIGYVPVGPHTLMEHIHTLAHPERAQPSMDSAVVIKHLTSSSPAGLEIADALGLAIAQSIALTDPGLVVLTGSVPAVPAAARALERAIDQHLRIKKYPVVVSRFGPLAPLIGAQVHIHRTALANLWPLTTELP